VNYFEMYDVEPPMWVRVATMHFTGPAKRWLQSVESLLSTTDWTKLCSMLHECFSRDQHELLLRQHFNIRQSSTVSDYVDKYQALIEQLKAYNPNPDLLSFTTRFIDGLRDDIRVVVLVARPTILDVAYTLALLQEEATEPPRCKDYKRADHAPYQKAAGGRGSLFLPDPPVRPQDDKAEAPKPPAPNDKFASLKTFRHARELCVRCGEKRVPGHRCSATPQFHALQEVWVLCQDDFDLPEEESPTEHADTAQVFLALSSAVASRSSAHHTM
jgi:hypothetical protein